MSSFDDIRARAMSQWETMQSSSKPRIAIGMGTCGIASGAEDVLNALNKALERHGIEADILQVGCIGLCYVEPMIEITKPGMPGIFYANLTPELVSEIVESYLVAGNPRPDLALGTRGEGTVEGIPRLFDLPVLKPQVRIVLRNCGNIDPQNINHYIANGGYEGLRKALEMSPQQVIDEIKRSGLRGRGGAGFLTGAKWQFCHDAPGSEKYVICNADEGDPGAFMNRALLEGDPHAVLEGILIGGYAMGASECYIYIRAEYPLAIQRLRVAIRQMTECGLLGQHVMGSDFSFAIKIKEGAGAFVCGEETALMASIEGCRGMPQSRPPFPAQAGLWGKPTNINNVETWADVSVILQKGADWYAGYGTEKSKGTKTFSLTGKILRTGLIEVPFGITLRDVIYGIGGGIPRGKRLKAVQTGGPSGGCLPPSLLDSPIDYEALAAAGSIMGSGGMVVMDEDTCMVDVAKYFLTFSQSESCGKCIPCRWGTKQMLDILEDITNGRGQRGDIELLLELANGVKAGALCGLGQAAPNTVLTTLRYFRDEYEAHINKSHCPAATCKGLVKAACSHTCPAGVDVPRYLRFIAQGKYNEALAVIRERIPFASICGYVCFHPCEARCRRGQIDDPIAIRALKRFAADHADSQAVEVKIAASTGKRVAVVGSGPAGLSAAYYLAKFGGHAVTVFEASPEAGGMMLAGIPRYRLPKDVLNREIDLVRQVGVEIKTNCRIESASDLLEQGFDAVFLALGAQKSRGLSVPGSDLPDVLLALDFLKTANDGRAPRRGKRVVVVGGGNVAMDVARVAVRLGAEKVTAVCLESWAEMPGHSWEIEEAKEEGVEIRNSWGPTRILADGRTVTGIEFQKCTSVFDAQRRFAPTFDKSATMTLDCDTVIIAIGQACDVPSSIQVKTTASGTLLVHPDTLATNIEGVFAGGDVTSGPASVIEAIAAGRQAAVSIDKYLGGKVEIQDTTAPPDVLPLSKQEDEERERHRPEMPKTLCSKRLKGFDPIELGFDVESAIEEAQRCLVCDLEEG